MNKNAFTLVEMIVGMTISMIVMIGLGVFVGGGISNMTLQEKILDNGDSYREFSSELQSVFSRIDKSLEPIITSSGVIMKQNKDFSDGGFSYIGTQTLSGVYCEQTLEYPDINPETDHVFIKNFIPFEESGENIFINYNDILISKSIAGYHTDQKNNVVIRDSDGTIIVGKGVFGDKFVEGDKGSDIYLNNPTGLASSGSLLFISDTLNNRIIVYDTTSEKVYNLLDETDGLIEPTGLYYDSATTSLYISNSGAGEILKYSSTNQTTNPELSLSGITQDSISKIEISFTGGVVNLTSPNSTDRFKFSSISSLSNDVVLIENGEKLKYYFINSFDSESAQVGCKLGEYIENVSGVLVKCTGTGTGQLANPGSVNFNSEDIGISDILPNFTSIGAYYVNLKLYDGNTVEYSGYFPYFTQGDGDLLTKDNNTLTVHRTGLNYPTGIWGSADGEYNQFLDGNYSNLAFDEDYDYKLNTPISIFSTDYTGKLLNLDFKYYKQYNCYNPDQKIERSFMMKKSFK